MIKLTFILIGLFLLTHFTLYYWNIDLYYLYTNPKPVLQQILQEEPPEYDFGNTRTNLEECLNELKQYNLININNESVKSIS